MKIQSSIEKHKMNRISSANSRKVLSRKTSQVSGYDVTENVTQRKRLSSAHPGKSNLGITTNRTGARPKSGGSNGIKSPPNMDI